MANPIPDILIRASAPWPRGRPCRVAFSGGVDSTVLLHALLRHRAELPGPLGAFHVDHGLQAGSEAWERHCRELCHDWQVPYRSFRVAGSPEPGRSPEEWAREARYRLLQRALEPGAILISAHHQDDQVETLLLQMSRGAGPAGLAAMPAWREFGSGFLARPLLGCSRVQIADYAAAHGLTWIEDPANAVSRFDRNFLRLELLPLLRRRWPGIDTTLGRVAELQAEALQVLDATAALDLAACRGSDAHRLRLQRLRAWSWPRQAGVLRRWIAELGLAPPARAHLQALRVQLYRVREDANPLVTWTGVEVRVFAGEILAGPPLSPRDGRESLTWALPQPCLLRHGRIEARAAQGRGLRCAAVPGDSVEVRLRQGGEWLRPAGDGHHRELRKLFQQVHLPPWLRARHPLLYVDGKLAAVPGLWVEKELAATGSEAGWELSWQDVDGPAG